MLKVVSSFLKYAAAKQYVLSLFSVSTSLTLLTSTGLVGCPERTERENFARVIEVKTRWSDAKVVLKYTLANNFILMIFSLKGLCHF